MLVVTEENRNNNGNIDAEKMTSLPVGYNVSHVNEIYIVYDGHRDYNGLVFADPPGMYIATGLRAYPVLKKDI